MISNHRDSKAPQNRRLNGRDDLNHNCPLAASGANSAETRPQRVDGPPPRLERTDNFDRKRRHTGSEPERRICPSSTFHGTRPFDPRRIQGGFVRTSTDPLRSPSGSIEVPVIDLTTPPARRPLQVSQQIDWIRQQSELANRLTNTGRMSDLELPRWQPDRDVSRCPVCETEFGFFIRRHHCRKCGRVVCASCSPHRITIPRQYIVQPPSTEEDIGVFGSPPGTNNSPATGGGEVVRVCNPCVPDPWTPSPSTARRSTSTPRSILAEPLSIAANRDGTHVASNALSFANTDAGQLPRTASLGRPSGMNIHQDSRNPGLSHDLHFDSDGIRGSKQNHDVAFVSSGALYRRRGGPSAQLSNTNSPHQPQQHRPQQHPIQASAANEGLNVDSRSVIERTGSGRSRYDPSTNRYLPPVASNRNRSNTFQAIPGVLRQLGVDDVAIGPSSMPGPGNFPGELPGLSSGSHYPRVSSRYSHRHSHSGSQRAPPPMPGSRLPPLPPAAHPLTPQHVRRQVREEDECPVCGVEMPPGEAIREAHIQECIASRFSSTPTQHARTAPLSANNSSPRPPNEVPEGSRPRATSYQSRGMLTYRATEKDCVTEEGSAQECVICFEEFEPGDEMGRMECLCKFHRHCIRQWWEKKGAGSCPTHQLHE